MTGIRSWMSATNSFASVVITRKSPNPLAGSRLFPVLPNAGDPERRAILHGDGVGLLRPLSLDRLPLEKAIHRHNAAPVTVGVPECRQLVHGLAFRVDRLAASGRVLAPTRDQAPMQRVQGHIAGLVITPDGEQLLARRSIPSRR